MQSAFFPAVQQQQSQQPFPASDSSHSRKAAVTHTAGSPSRHHSAGPGGISSQQVGGRAPRFPSSRRYLWDKTAAGPQVLVDALDYLPHVQVAASTFGAISKAASSKASSLTLQLGLSVSSSNQVTALIQEHDPLSTQGALQLSCALLQPGAAGADAASSLRAAVQARVNQRDIARVQQLYALSATAAAAASPADPTTLRLQVLMPRAGLLATPLYTKRLCHVPLAEALLKPGCMATGQTGYLSMDQARSLLPLEATDANMYSTPLVGVWVKGPSSVLHPLVTAACLRFAYSSLLMDRAVSTEDGAFLLLLCPEGDPVSKCFEVQVTDSSKLELACYKLEAGVRPAAGLSQYPGGVVSAPWVPEQCQVQPLPGTLAGGGVGHMLQAGSNPGAYSKAETAAGTPSRFTGGYGFGRGVHEPSPSAADSPVLYGHAHASRAGEHLPLGRSSAPSAAFGAGGQPQQGAAAAAAAAAARRSLPLQYYGGGSSRDAAVGAGEQPWDPYSAAGLASFGGDEPQPRLGIPAAYTPSVQPQGNRQPWQHQQQHEGQVSGTSPAAAAGAAAGVPDMGGFCSSPTRGSRQQQLTWSDSQEQVLRTSLEGAAEALRSSQASLAAAREAASGAGTRLSRPTKARGAEGGADCAAPGGGPQEGGAVADAGSAAAAAEAAPAAGQQVTGAGVQSAGLQPGLSRLGGQQQHVEAGDADVDCGPRMGYPVRLGAQRKSSMLAAAAAHAAGVSAAAGASSPAAVAGSECSAQGEKERPVSPAVQAGVALSNLSLLQHLSAGQLQREGSGLEAVGHAAVAAAAACGGGGGGSPMAAGRSSYVAAITEGQQQPSAPAPAGWDAPAQAHASAAAGSAGAYGFGAAQGPAIGPGSAAVTESFNSSHAAAAAIHAAASSMQRLPVHPYSSQSLGVQRYAAETAVVRSSQGSPAGRGLVSPGSSPGMPNSSCARWQPLQQHQQHQHDVGAQLQSAWSPGMTATPGVVGASGGSSMRASPHWRQQQQQYGGQQQQQVSPMSAALSPGWVPDPVAQALQGEVDRLRQQLQQLQLQLRLAGMALPNPDLDTLDTASGAGTPAAQVAAATPPAQTAAAPAALITPAVTPEAAPAAAAVPAAAAAVGSPRLPYDGVVHINVFLSPGARSPQVHLHDQLGVTAHDTAERAWQQAAAAAELQPPQQQQQLEAPAQQYSAVSYARTAAATPADAAQAPADASAAQAQAAEAPAVAATEVDAGDGPVQEPALAEGPVGPTAAAAGVPPAALAQHQGQSTATAAAAAAAESASQQAAAAATAARQRRRKLDFEAAAAAAAAAGDVVCDSPGDSSTDGGSVGEAVAESDGQGAANTADPTAAEAQLGACEASKEGDAAGATHPVPCSSPAIKHKAPTSAAAKTSLRHPAYASPDPTPAAAMAAAMPAAAGLRSSAASSTAGIMRYSVSRSSVPRSSGGGLGHLRASLDAPPLVEVVRTRVVDLSDDSDSEEWEDRLLVKYELK